ncbi:class I SAM-dependent methyltransferase [Bacillus pumilus]|uniref:class I SAM-dependent methyltransferase n=1 Tax=Bacillus pumilus TaxID=1408 RepID=UPI001CD4FEA4|nr:class I SAM-dependent methyltransferase [Bacillus pumilus]
MLITTSFRANEQTIETAKALAEDLHGEYVERRKQSVKQLALKRGDVLVVGKERFEWYQPNGEKFFFHPSSAMFRVKRLLREEKDPLIEAAQLKPGDSFLDCTLGLGSDAMTASFAVGRKGKTVGIEKNPITALLVREGLNTWETGIEEADEAMKRISVISGDSIEQLKKYPDGSFDVVYFDPMFEETIQESTSIAPLRHAAEHDFDHEAAVLEALRVARKRVVLKDHWKSTRFKADSYQFQVIKRKTAQFHYGYIEKEKSPY